MEGRQSKLHGKGAPLRTSVGFLDELSTGDEKPHTPGTAVQCAALKIRPCLHRPDVCPVCLVTPQTQVQMGDKKSIYARGGHNQTTVT